MFVGFGMKRGQIVRLILPEIHDLGQKTQRTPDGWTAQFSVPTSLIETFFPGFRLEGDRTIVMETHDFMDVLRAVQFVL